MAGHQDATEQAVFRADQALNCHGKTFHRTIAKKIAKASSPRRPSRDSEPRDHGPGSGQGAWLAVDQKIALDALLFQDLIYRNKCAGSEWEVDVDEESQRR